MSFSIDMNIILKYLYKNSMFNSKTIHIYLLNVNVIIEYSKLY